MFKSELFEHQKEMLEFLRSHPEGVALFSVMGSGKTRTVIARLDELFFSHEIEKALVIAPKSILKNWEFEISESSDLTSTILTDKKANLDTKIHIINYDRIVKYYLFLVDQQYDIMILDESTYIKNRWAKRTKAIYELSKVIPMKILMTGTPITQSVLDIFSQYLILDGGKTFGKSIVEFRNRYMINVSRSPKFPIWVDRRSKLPELKEKMYSLAITPDPAKIKLPVRRTKLLTFQLSPEQNRVYNDLYHQDFADLDISTLTATEIVTKYIKFRQICSGFVIDDNGNVKEFDENPKLEELLEQLKLLKDLKVVIWRNFKVEKDILMRNIKDLIIFDDNPFEEIAKFNKLKSGVALASLSQIKFGLNIYADVAIYFGNTFSFSDRAQSESRHLRINSTNENVLFLDIVAEHTIDETIFNFQKRRKDISDTVLKRPDAILFGKGLNEIS